MGLSFVPITIASLAGVERADAGVASGLVNTSRQIGGAIGIAAISAIAATAPGLDGLHDTFYAMLGLLLIAALGVALLLKPQTQPETLELPVLADLQEAA